MVVQEPAFACPSYGGLVKKYLRGRCDFCRENLLERMRNIRNLFAVRKVGAVMIGKHVVDGSDNQYVSAIASYDGFTAHVVTK